MVRPFRSSDTPFFHPWCFNWANSSSSQDTTEIFQLFLTPEVLEHIISETNSNARDMCSPQWLDNWTDVTENELYVYLGLTF